MICLQLAGRRESLLEKLTVLCLSSRTLCFMPLVWELTRGSCSSAWATMNCICGAGSPTPLRCSRWKPRPARRSTRKNWKGERDCGERGQGGRDKWHHTAGVQQAVVPAGQQPVTWVVLRWGMSHPMFTRPVCGPRALAYRAAGLCYSSGSGLWPALLSCKRSVQAEVQQAPVWWCTAREGFSWLLSFRAWSMC